MEPPRGAATLVLAALALWGCAPSASTPPREAPGVPVAQRFPIDGAVDLEAVGAVHERVVELMDGAGAGTVVKSTTVRWAARNDDRHVYLAVEWGDATPSLCDPAALLTEPFDAVFLELDGDGDGTFEDGEDVRRLLMTRYGSMYGDLHRAGASPLDDAVADGMGKLTHSAGTYRAELLIPVAPDAAAEDRAVGAATRFDLLFYEGFTISPWAGNVGRLSGAPAGGASTSSWERLPWTAPGPFAQPALPSSLTGLLVFIGDHENPQGELYTFDPATGAISRVTHDTGLYLDGASLSHDRTRIAFHGAPSPTDFARFEVFTVGVDGSGLTSITHNALLDAHPAWSPGDGELVYASFRSGGAASLIRTTPAGVELANLTPAGANDNDPDWLPDGRIVFKTDRFGPAGSPEVRIAVMDADGTGVRQLTGPAGTSDHDATATDTVAVFERFTKGTDYASDPSSQFTPWDLVEARVDGGGERPLLADGWINWLPVHDPTHRYLAHLKTVGPGYTEVRLLTADGADLGRLIPGLTRIRYLDWK